MNIAPQDFIEEKFKALKKQRRDVEKLIQQDIKPQASKIEKSIEAYRAYIQLSNFVCLNIRYEKGREQDLTIHYATDSDEDKGIEYHPKEYIDTEFQTSISEDMDTIIRECRYLNLTVVRFNFRGFGIEVNGRTKACQDVY